MKENATHKKVVAKGERLKWAPLKSVKSENVKLDANIKGKMLTASDFSQEQSKQAVGKILVP